MARIIAADDDLAMRQIYSYMLDNLGHDAEICQNGQEAVDAFRRQSADLIILDITMPIMDGLDSCREIRKLPGGIKVPIIIVSGNNSEEDIAAGFNAGANDYLLKPVRETALVAKLKNFLKTSSLHGKEFELVKNHVVFLDRYKIVKVLGYGSHSVVFLAEDQYEPRQVAIKLLNESIAEGAVLDRFIELVGKYAMVPTEYFLEIIDYGLNNDQVYLIMPYAEEGDLRKKTVSGQLSEYDAARIGRDIVDSLLELDYMSLCHLDVKPENIILHEGRYKLADFGMVTRFGSGTIPLKTEIWSTAAYACPESFDSPESVDIRSDIYSLGVTLFEMVTGDNPFLSDKATVSMYRHVNLNPPYISGFKHGYSMEFSALISEMLRKDPAERMSLKELQYGLSVICNCYEKNNKSLLTYPKFDKTTVIDPEDLISKTKTNMSALKELTISEEKGTAAAFFDKIGEASFGFLMSNSGKKVDKSKNKLPMAKAVILVVILGILFNTLGYMVYSAFEYTPAEEDNLPLIKVMCRKCGYSEVAPVRDIDDLECLKCGGNVGYSMLCRDCGKTFSWRQPDVSKVKSIKEQNVLIQNSLRCPFCKSSKTQYMEPSKTKQK